MNRQQVCVQFRAKAAGAANTDGMPEEPIELDARHGRQIGQHTTIRREQNVSRQSGTLDRGTLDNSGAVIAGAGGS